MNYECKCRLCKHDPDRIGYKKSLEFYDSEIKRHKNELKILTNQEEKQRAKWNLGCSYEMVACIKKDWKEKGGKRMKVYLIEGSDKRKDWVESIFKERKDAEKEKIRLEKEVETEGWDGVLYEIEEWEVL